MEFSQIVWGLAVLGAGIFLTVYGTLLFRFALLAMGFAVGMVGVWWLLDGQSEATRILIALVAGAIIGFVFYSMVKFGLYIAGAMLGATLAVVAGGVIDIFSSAPGDVLWVILGAAGVVGGGFFGPRLGNFIILLATSATGALLVIEGIRVLFESRIGGDVTDPTSSLTQRLTLTIFLVILIISALSQHNASQLRHRVLR